MYSEDSSLKKEEKNLYKLMELIRLNKDLNSRLNLEILLNEFLYHLEKIFSSDNTIIFLKKNRIYNSLWIRSKFKRDSILLQKINNIVEYMVKKNCNSLLYIPGQEVDGDSEIKKELSAISKQLIIVPFSGNYNIVKAICLTRDLDSPYFNFDDFTFLNIFAFQIGAMLENAWLYGQILEMNNNILKILAKAVEAKDSYIKGHSEHVACYGVKLGKKLGLTSDELNKLYWAGIVHDVGKIGVPDNILNKPGELTGEEFEIIKKHPRIGAEILSQNENLKDIIPIVYNHHERIDGTGYPENKNGQDIPFLAKIISVVDAYDAMTSDRAYRKALPHSQACAILEAGAGSQWDEELVYHWIN